MIPCKNCQQTQQLKTALSATSSAINASVCYNFVLVMPDTNVLQS